MRIWLCPSAFSPHRGGVEELTLKLAQHLQQRGHELLVVTNRWPDGLREREEVEGVAVARVRLLVPTRHPRTWLPWIKHHRLLRLELEALGPAPEVVHIICPAGQTGPVALRARRGFAALVLTTQGETVMDADRLYEVNPWMRRELRRVSARADALTACSVWTREQAARIAPALQHADIVLNGVDAADWPEQVPVDDPIVLAWGRHVPQKGFDLLIAAFVLVRRSRPDARLLLGGDGPETLRLRAGAPDYVEFLGSLGRSGVRDALQRARVVVVPSRVEPFGIVALEALAAGKGLVYSSRGGLAEATGPCGRAADPEDALALSEAIVAELNSPTPAAVGRHRAAQLDWSRLAARYEAVYARALSHRDSRTGAA